ncbi:MAG: hypothetical protein O3B76_09535 [Proteobacteria bacterium]|nr:hypothetical protein [Pseudomonadota bacterium]MDA1023776.1 hypothetical protein [Pseudomonadota bacterium]
MADGPAGGGKIPEPTGGRQPAKNPDKTPDPTGDDDDLDDFLLESTYGKISIWMRLGYFLLLAGIAAMVGYLVLLVVFPEKFASQDWIGEKSQKTKTGTSIAVDLTLLKSFKIGGLSMSFTPEEARRTFPSLSLTANPNFGPSDQVAQFGHYRHHDGEYKVFFRGPKQGNRLFKVESRHTYSKISYLELLTELSGRYGKPQKSDCGAQEKQIGISCELYWRMSETLVSAKILTTAPKGGGPSVTELFMQATDIRTNIYFSRLKIQLEDREEEAKKKRDFKDVKTGK